MEAPRLTFQALAALLLPWFRRACLLWFLLVIFSYVSIRWLGERHISLAMLVYAPPGMWLLPLAPLICFNLAFRDIRSILYCTAAATVTLLGLFQYRLPWSNSIANAPQLTVVSCNIGQRAKVSLRPFKDAIKPDLIALQESPSRADRYLAAADYKEFPHAASLGEFTLLSRHPIVKKDLIQPSAIRASRKYSRSLAARYEIDLQGQHLAIYSVHLFSPREALLSSWKGAIVYGLLGWPGTPWNDRRLALERFWDDQALDIADLKAAIAQEALPHLVLGDFNSPSIGRHFQLISEHLQDTHALAGTGSGHTFPGSTHNPLSAFGPWLRLDAILASAQFTVLSTQVEPPSPAQHLAVAATLTLPKP